MLAVLAPGSPRLPLLQEPAGSSPNQARFSRLRHHGRVNKLPTQQQAHSPPRTQVSSITLVNPAAPAQLRPPWRRSRSLTSVDRRFSRGFQPEAANRTSRQPGQVDC